MRHVSLGPSVRWNHLEDDLGQVSPGPVLVALRNSAARHRVAAGLLARGIKVVFATLPGPATPSACLCAVAIVDHATLLSVHTRDPKALRQSVVLVLGPPTREAGGPWVRVVHHTGDADAMIATASAAALGHAA